jgi:hypothetical protein
MRGIRLLTLNAAKKAAFYGAGCLRLATFGRVCAAPSILALGRAAAGPQPRPPQGR